MLMNTAVTVVCWKRKRRVRWDGTTGGDKPRRAIELPREAPSSTFPILREPAATVFNKVPLVAQLSRIRSSWKLKTTHPCP